MIFCLPGHWNLQLESVCAAVITKSFRLEKRSLSQTINLNNRGLRAAATFQGCLKSRGVKDSQQMILRLGRCDVTLSAWAELKRGWIYHVCLGLLEWWSLQVTGTVYPIQLFPEKPRELFLPLAKFTGQQLVEKRLLQPFISARLFPHSSVRFF